MWQPKYSLTPDLLNHLTTIERLYGQIEGVQLPQKLELNLKRDNLIQSSYASNKIEGNPMTLPEVTNLLLDDRIPVNRDEKEVVNYFEMLSSLNEYGDEKISIDLVTKLHKELFEGVHEEAGKVRNEQVVIGRYTGEEGNASFRVKHNPPYHKREEIEAEMTRLFEWVNTDQQLPAMIKAGMFHHELVYVHPFEDGNGRICRVLTALMLIQNNYLINKYFVLDDYYDIDRNLYSDKLHTADDGDKTEWLEYFTEGVMYSLQSALVKVQNLVKTMPVPNRPSKKEEQVLEVMRLRPEITSMEVAEELQVSRQQAHNLLKNLVTKGLIEKEGSTKSSYYVMK